MNYLKHPLSICLLAAILFGISRPWALAMENANSLPQSAAMFEDEKASLQAAVSTAEPTQHSESVADTSTVQVQRIQSTLQITDENGALVPEAYALSNMGSTVVTTFIQNGHYRITGTVDHEVAEKITLPDGFVGSITLNNVKLFYNHMGGEYKNQSPMEVAPNAQAVIYLEGENSIRAPQYFAAIEFAGNVTGSLVIDSKTGGSLYAAGGGSDAAAIGGIARFVEPGREHTANIEIRGGSIRAEAGGSGGAAIGSAAKGDVDNIVISGGTVVANSNAGAAIGSGENGTASNIRVTGGVITANATAGSEKRAAAIGSGVYGALKNVEISGGYIETTTAEGVGIGAGFSYTSKPVNEIKITGGTIVINKTSSSNGYTGIGVTRPDMTIENITIDGGSIRTGGTSIVPKNSDGEELVLLAMTHADTVAATIDGQNQNLSGIAQNNLYFYMTKKDHILGVTDIHGVTTFYYVKWRGVGFDTPVEMPQQQPNEWLQVPSIAGWKYGESPNAPVGAAKYGKVVFSYSNQLDGVYTSSVPQTAGTYYMKAVVDETLSYSGLQHIVSFTISKAESTITISDQLDRVFDGTASVEPTVEVTGSTKAVAFTWYQATEDGWIVLETPPVNVGSYQVIAMVSEDENYHAASVQQEFSISKAENTWLISPSIQGWNYGDKPNAPVGSAKYGEVAFLYSSEQEGVYTGEIPQLAGTYYMKAAVAETSNYSGLESIVSFTISQTGAGSKVENSWTVEPSIQGWNYGELPGAPVGSAKYGTVVFLYSSQLDGVYTQVVPQTAGSYYMKAVVEEGESYLGLERVVPFTISKAQSLITIGDHLDRMFDGTPSAATDIAVTGSKQVAVVSWYEAGLEGWNVLNAPPVNAGRYKLVVTVAADENYHAASVEREFAISKAENSWLTSPSIQGWWHGDKPNAPVGSAKYGEVLFLYSPQQDGVYTHDIPQLAGTYYMKAIVAETSNYSGLASIASFTISSREATQHQVTVSKSENSWSISPSIQGWRYGEKPSVPRGAAKFGEVVFSYSSQQNGVYTSAVPQSIGTYYMKATVAEAGNYSGLESIVSFTISKGKSTLTIRDHLDRAFDGSPCSAPLDIAITGSTCVPIISWYQQLGDDWTRLDMAPTNAGTYKVVAEVAADEYYSSVRGEKKFIISKAKNPQPKLTKIPDWIVNQEPKIPKVETQFGTPMYTYSNQKDGEYTLEQPQTAGTWYMKISVEETENYEGWEQVIPFQILPAGNSELAVSDASNEPPAFPSGVFGIVIAGLFIVAAMGIVYYRKRQK